MNITNPREQTNNAVPMGTFSRIYVIATDIKVIKTPYSDNKMKWAHLMNVTTTVVKDIR